MRRKKFSVGRIDIDEGKAGGREEKESACEIFRDPFFFSFWDVHGSNVDDVLIRYEQATYVHGMSVGSLK